MAIKVGAGVDRLTGRPLDGYAHAVQSLGVIFTTGFGSRVMRRWFGSLIPEMLGRSLTPDTLVRVFTALYVAMAFEPRLALKKVNVLASPETVHAALRAGRIDIELEIEYRPRAHLGDLTPEGGMRRVVLATSGGTTAVATAAA